MLGSVFFSSKDNEERPFHLKKWKNHVTQRAAIITLISFGLSFLIFGVCFRFFSCDLLEYNVRYDEKCMNTSSPCIVTINVKEDMKGTVALLYKLDGFYQNHRRMFNSKNYPQLAGKYVKNKIDLSSCDPAISKGGSNDPNDLYIPCGLMATSFFNDYYRWMNTSIASFSDVNISQDYDRKDLFKPINASYKQGIRILLNNSDFPGETINEHFIVWMRAAAMPQFLKLFSRCENCYIPKGEYQIEVRMHYPKSMFHGARYIYLTRAGGLGSGSSFLSSSYIIAGGFSTLMGLLFFIHMLIFPRKYGDLSGIWNSHLYFGKDQNLLVDDQ